MTPKAYLEAKERLDRKASGEDDERSDALFERAFGSDPGTTER